MCSACGNNYAPERQPRAGERNFCQPCRDRGEPERLAAAAYRKRKKDEKPKGKSKSAVKKS
jgi:hypothetical protein